MEIGTLMQNRISVCNENNTRTCPSKNNCYILVMCLDPPSEYFGQNRRFSQRTKRLYHTNTAAAMTGNIWVGFLIL